MSHSARAAAAACIFVASTMTACRAPLDQADEDANSSLHSDSGANQQGYDAIIDKMRALAQRNDLVQVLSYGKTARGKDLYLVRIGKPASGGTNKPMVVFSEATHGNEYLDVITGVTDSIAANAGTGALKTFFHDKQGVMIVVPVVNVDGYEYHRTTSPAQRRADGGPDAGNSWGRLNGARVDINRDFPIKDVNFAGFAQPESKAYAQALIEQLKGGYKLHTSIDYHCCLGDGALLYPYQYSRTKRLSQTELQRFLTVGNLMKSQIPTIRISDGPSLAGYEARGVSNDYFYAEHGSTSFVYEGKQGGEANRLDQHIRTWTSIIDAAAKTTSDQSQTPQSPQISKDDNVKLALGEASTSGVKVAIAAAEGATALLCRGSFTDCAKADRKIELEFEQATIKNGRALFLKSRGDVGLKLEANQTYSVLVKKSSSDALRGIMIRFEAK